MFSSVFLILLNVILFKSSEKVEKKPFDFDEWCKDIDQHPIFMTEKSDMSKCLNGKYGDTIAAIQVSYFLKIFDYVCFSL